MAKTEVAPDSLEDEQHHSPFPWSGLAAAGVSVLVVLVIISALLAFVDVDPATAWNSVWDSTFGSKRNFGETLVRATPLLVIALTLMPSLRAGLYNIGAPGQVAAGGLAVTVVALNTPQIPAWLSLTICVTVAAVAGGLVGAFPGLLKARYGVNEIITTLAMNFIVIAVVGWLLSGPLKGSYANLPQSEALPDNAAIPVLIPDTRAHIGLIVALAFIPMLWAFDRSRSGYRLRVFGANPHLSQQAGISQARYIVGLMAFGGMGAGIAGWMQVAAVDERLYPTVADPIGYAGLFVALLGALHPVGILVAAFALGALLHGGDGLQVSAGVSPEIAQVFLGLILIAYTTQRSSRTQVSTGSSTRRLRWTLRKRS